MARNTVPEWSETAGDNTDVGGINVAEGMNPGGVNNALREIMAQIRSLYSESVWRRVGWVTTNGNLNTLDRSGLYTWNGATDNGAPFDSSYGVLLHLQRDTDRAVQIGATCGARNSVRICMREQSGDGWSGWWEFLKAPRGADGMFKVTADGAMVGVNLTSPISVLLEQWGFSASADGLTTIARAGGGPALRVKLGANGTLVQFNVGSANVATIDVASGVVTYGSFCGAHEAQFRSYAMPDVPRGTILETIDEMCAWPDENGVERPDQILPRIQIAEEGSTAVYGVFSHWKTDGSRDLVVASLGMNLIRLAPGVAPVRGMLVQAGPNGCGVPQAGETPTTRTVAKVASAVVAETLPDGSFLVPASLHCG